MSYHHKNLGKFSASVRRFADLNGYVPEPGDTPGDFTWGAGVEWADDEWSEHVEAAAIETARAECLVALWQDGDRPSPGTVREVRGFLGLTQTEFGEEMGVSLRTIQYWETEGDRSPGKSESRVMQMLVREEI